MPIQLQLFSEDEIAAFVSRMGGLRVRLAQPLAKAFHQGALEIVGRAVRLRFTGKGPYPKEQHKLGVQTGRLRRSLTTTAPQVNARTGEISVSLGSNVEYFAIHEFGFRGKVQVRGHTRRMVRQKRGRDGRLTRGTQTAMRKKLSARHFEGRGKAYASVRPHSRKLDVPARRPLGTTIEEPASRAILRGKVKRVVDVVTREAVRKGRRDDGRR